MIIKAYLFYLVAMSLVSFLLYAIDKYKAKKKLWRIRESILLGFGFLGGALGALLGMELVRHKTRHWYFWVVNILGLLLQAGLLFLLLRSRIF